ncbi:MAG: signal peptidase I [Fimbriimonadaceae bacterium]|nr:signal peptidase I [Fimbriimonadaceae bacterium]QYK59635.1 MAG: signal peptidase I [Fimbriimonadaceae bacterium]
MKYNPLVSLVDAPGFGRRKRAFRGFGVFLAAVLGFALFFQMNFQTVSVRGNSMEPTFNSGDRLLVSKAYWLVGPIRLNDIVVVRMEKSGDVLIKRVKGLSGDVIDFIDVPTTWKIGMGEYRVPEGTLYLLGDNRPVSQDSRVFGPFEPKDVVGKVVIYGTEPWVLAMVAVGVLGLVAMLATNIQRPQASEIPS